MINWPAPTWACSRSSGGHCCVLHPRRVVHHSSIVSRGARWSQVANKYIFGNNSTKKQRDYTFLKLMDISADGNTFYVEVLTFLDLNKSSAPMWLLHPYVCQLSHSVKTSGLGRSNSEWMSLLQTPWGLQTEQFWQLMHGRTWLESLTWSKIDLSTNNKCQSLNSTSNVII